MCKRLYNVVIKDDQGNDVGGMEVEWEPNKVGGLIRLIENTLDETAEPDEV